ncbi:hypothetical protein ANCDUO_10974 [Ancylostoma duodenale]|uniref:Uncharacterized protein n=1 Tax=Ancylostoma duodenale TaxID=51022 RepID=A0A0C2GP91_9BILA|nr:hypothetical protein ANCDUO_10974 [Ancylostoma duodenale]
MQSVDEAREVRIAMHNTQWPAANPKTLSVQFDTKENRKDDRERKRHRSETPPFSRGAVEKRERRDSYQKPDRDHDRDHDRVRDRDRERGYDRRRDDDRGRHRDERDEEKEKEREEKPVKTADSYL